MGKTEEVRLVPQGDRKPFEELILRIYVYSADGDKVKVNLPMLLVKVCMEMGTDLSATVGGNEAMRSLDLKKIVDLAERGMVGKLVEVESADGDYVEVVVE